MMETFLEILKIIFSVTLSLTILIWAIYRGYRWSGKTIDTLAPEKREVLDKIYERFQLPDGTCGCPLCKAIKNREDADA